MDMLIVNGTRYDLSEGREITGLTGEQAKRLHDAAPDKMLYVTPWLGTVNWRESAYWDYTGQYSRYAVRLSPSYDMPKPGDVVSAEVAWKLCKQGWVVEDEDRKVSYYLVEDRIEHSFWRGGNIDPFTHPKRLIAYEPFRVHCDDYCWDGKQAKAAMDAGMEATNTNCKDTKPLAWIKKTGPDEYSWNNTNQCNWRSSDFALYGNRDVRWRLRWPVADEAPTRLEDAAIEPARLDCAGCLMALAQGECVELNGLPRKIVDNNICVWDHGRWLCCVLNDYTLSGGGTIVPDPSIPPAPTWPKVRDVAGISVELYPDTVVLYGLMGQHLHIDNFNAIAQAVREMREEE